MNNEISYEELDKFLKDIYENISKDEETDFRKLTVYLFRFSKIILNSIVDNENYEKYNDVFKELMKAIDFVLSKKTFLLLEILDNEEIEFIYVPELEIDKENKIKKNYIFCEWIILFATEHFGIFHENNNVIKEMKYLIINVINLVANRLRKFNELVKIRIIFIKIINFFKDFFQIEINLLKIEHRNCLSIINNVLSIVYDCDLSNKLVLNTLFYRSILMNLNKKVLNVILKIDHVINKKYTRFINTMKINFLMYNFNNLMNNESKSWIQISIFFQLFISFFEIDFSLISSIYSEKEFNDLIKILCFLLLKLFKFCLEKNISDVFINYFYFKGIQNKNFCLNNEIKYCDILEIFENSNQKVPYLLFKSIHLVNYFCKLKNNNHSLIKTYSKNNVEFLTKFDNESLNYLSLQIEEIIRFKYLKKNQNSSTESNFQNLFLKSKYEFDHDLFLTKFNNFNFMEYVYSLSKKNKIDDVHFLFFFFTHMRNFPCKLNNDFDFKVFECKKCCSCFNSKNVNNKINLNRKSIITLPEINTYYNNIICQFILNEEMKKYRRNHLICCNFLLSIYSLFSSFSPPKTYLDQDPVLNFIFDLLKYENNRDIRMLASIIVPLYLIQSKDKIVESNFNLIFNRLSSIDFSKKNNLHLAESTINTFFELAFISDGLWLCSIFTKLTNMLNDENNQHVNFVYKGFTEFAQNKSTSLYKLMSPFFSNLSEIIIKNPKIFNKISQLLNISKKNFIFKTKEYTTHKFLQQNNLDQLKKIAQNSNLSKIELISKFFSKIIASFLVKENDINENKIMEILCSVSSHYKNIKLSNILYRVGEIIWYILLNIETNENNEIINKQKILNSLEYLSKNSLKINLSLKINNKLNLIKHLLDEHILELVQKFSENVHYNKGKKSWNERLNSLRAIDFIIQQNPQSITLALGQVSTCLQASLNEKKFQFLTLICFNSLVTNLKFDNLISILDIIISSILQKINEFEKESREIAIDILKKIFTVIEKKNYNYFSYFLSLKNFDVINKNEFNLKNLIYNIKINFFQEFTRRLQISNEYVVKQALLDLYNFLQKFQLKFQSIYLIDHDLEIYVSDLIRTLLDTSFEFKNSDDLICTDVAKVLSAFGSLDFNKFNSKVMKKTFIVLYDFEDYEEMCEYLINFIENFLIKIFLAFKNPMKQLFFAYAMQNFLRLMNLDNSVLKSQDQNIFKNVWNKFNEVSKSILTPLLSSKYVAPFSEYIPLEYPYFKVTLKHEKWIKYFLLDLIKRPLLNNENETKIKLFQTFSKLIQDENVFLCDYLLRYIVLSHILSGCKKITKEIKDEFLNILHTDLINLSSDYIELVKHCYQSVFKILDYFNEWISESRQHLYNISSNSNDFLLFQKQIILVGDFLNFIPMDLMAIKSAECDSYERTIFYLEKCYHDNKIDKNLYLENLNVKTTLQLMYSNIKDYDSLEGILKKFPTNNLIEKLTSFQYNENWVLVQESFHVLSSGKNDNNKKHITQLLSFYNNHGLYNETLSTLNNKVDFQNLSTISFVWALFGLKASILLNDNTQIEKWFYMVNLTNKHQNVEYIIEYEFLKATKFLLYEDIKNFNCSIDKIYKIIGTSLIPSSLSSFSRNMNLMNYLHIIYDLSLILNSKNQKSEILELNEKILKARFNNTDSEFYTKWNLLVHHNIANQIMKDKKKISENYIQCSKLARKNCRLDFATRLILKAMALNDYDSNIEYSMLLWTQKKQSEAIRSLLEILKINNFNNNQTKSKLQLRYANWLDQTNHSSSNIIILEYLKAINLNPKWEKSHYYLGNYYNKILDSLSDNSGYYEKQTIKYYFNALTLGDSYIFEALPKSITIWLDFAQKKNKSKESEKNLDDVINDIINCVDSIPIYIWYTSLSQILSRIIHIHKPSFALLGSIVISVIKEYPKHSLWYVLSHSNSNDIKRRERINEILFKIKNENNSYNSIVTNSKVIFNTLIRITSFVISKNSKVTKMSLRKDFRIADLDFSCDSLIVPIRFSLEIHLPRDSNLNFEPFPKSLSITLNSFQDEVNIFYSLQIPRQITVKGSDGKFYKLLLKKDDIRKDAKFMEFTTMINNLFSFDNKARKRFMSISNYSVIPLNENMGVIEFVDNVQTLKSIINEQRLRIGTKVNEKVYFTKLEKAQINYKKSDHLDSRSLETLINTFKSISEKNPPILHSWFTHQFSDPSVWYNSKNMFIITCAVMSIVGYIIGLGDRHCENILLFKKKGSILHIDFDCLFDKGKLLPTPEIVPFRLTKNLVSVMGITGTDGIFKKICEITSFLIQKNEASLMNILETLLYDPLLDWKNLQNPQDLLSRVKNKIRGITNESELPMSINGQTEMLVQEATSIENLSQMYCGWLPYI